MGLDAVELVMEVEDRFAIKLDDKNLSQIRTVAELAALVSRELQQQAPAEACPSAHTFYAFRRGLMQVGIERDRVRPRTLLHDLLPSPRSRRAVWQALTKDIRRLPDLEMSPARHKLEGGLYIGGVAVAAAFAFTVYVGAGIAASVGVLVAVLCIGGWTIATIAGPWRSEFPLQLVTVGDAVRATRPMEINSDGQRLEAEYAVLQEVRRITADVLGVSIEKVQPGSDLIRDFA